MDKALQYLSIARKGGMAELAALLRRAERENRWVIHYGI